MSEKAAMIVTVVLLILAFSWFQSEQQRKLEAPYIAIEARKNVETRESVNRGLTVVSGISISIVLVSGSAIAISKARNAILYPQLSRINPHVIAGHIYDPATGMQVEIAKPQPPQLDQARALALVLEKQGMTRRMAIETAFNAMKSLPLEDQ